MDHLDIIVFIPVALFLVYWMTYLGPKKEWEKMLRRLATQPCPHCGELVGMESAAQAYENEAARIRKDPHDQTTPNQYTAVQLNCRKCETPLSYIVLGRELIKRPQQTSE